MQLSIVLGFTLTEYKIQDITFNNVIVNLKRQSRGGIIMHKRFCSTYIQLFLLCTFAGLGLLQSINIIDINN